MSESFDNEPKRKKNAYTCTICKTRIVTEDVVDGVTPFMLGCRADKQCRGSMQSHFYQIDQNEVATYEWYRPSLRSAAKQGQEMYEHVKRGGLDMRKKGEAS